MESGLIVAFIADDIAELCCLPFVLFGVVGGSENGGVTVELGIGSAVLQRPGSAVDEFRPDHIAGRAILGAFVAMQSGFEKFGRKSKRELFLEEMDRIVPWSGLVGLIEPHYPKGEQGRPPVGVERMLRLYFLQQWFNLSDPGLEDALYESPVLRLFAGIDLGREPAPDETTILHFRHLLEKHDLGRKMLKMVNEYLALCGVRVSTGTIVASCIRPRPQRLTSRTRRCCRSCCTATSARYGATQPIRGRARRFTARLLMRRI